MQNKTHLSRAVILGLAATLALAGCKKNENTSEMTPPAASDTAPAATPGATPATTPDAAATPGAATPGTVNVSSVTVGNTAGADKSVTPVATLGTKDKIIVSVKTDGTASNANLAVRLTYQDGQVAGEQTATLNTSGPDTTNVEFSNANGWPAGRYKAEVTVNGQTAGMPQEFEVK
jgi:hypothetical protein